MFTNLIYDLLYSDAAIKESVRQVENGNPPPPEVERMFRDVVTNWENHQKIIRKNEPPCGCPDCEKIYKHSAAVIGAIDRVRAVKSAVSPENVQSRVTTDRDLANGSTMKSALSTLQRYIYDSMEAKGLHARHGDVRSYLLARLALVHTEVSEATQLVKRHVPQGGAYMGDEFVLKEFGEELADVAIRLFDLAGDVNVDLGKAIVEKMEANLKRPHGYGTPEEKKASVDGAVSMNGMRAMNDLPSVSANEKGDLIVDMPVKSAPEKPKESPEIGKVGEEKAKEIVKGLADHLRKSGFTVVQIDSENLKVKGDSKKLESIFDLFFGPRKQG